MVETKAVIAIVHDWGSVADALDHYGAYILETDTKAELERVFDHIDGLVLTGGEDIDPAKYRATSHKYTHSYGVSDRDRLEYWAVREARRRRIPMLGICRGHQMLNVAHGGTLHQHVPDLDASDQHGSSHHPVVLRRKSKLGQYLGMDKLDSVMSLHHQAVDRVGHSLVPIGWSEDGVIEAIESVPGSRPYVLGTQFHPEIDYSSYSWSYADMLFDHWMKVVSNTVKDNLSARIQATFRESKDHKDAQRKVTYYPGGTSQSSAYYTDDDDTDNYESWLERNAYSNAIAEDWDEWDPTPRGLRNVRSTRRDMLSESDTEIKVLSPASCDKLCAFPPCQSPYDCGSWGDCAAEAVANQAARDAKAVHPIDSTILAKVDDALDRFTEVCAAHIADAQNNYDKDGRPLNEEVK